MRLLWLPEVLRAAGLTVHTYDGWKERGSDRWGEVVGFGPLRGVVCHATAGSRRSTDEGEMRVLWETGSSSAPAPISQLYLSRSGEWTVGASGRCNHVLRGDKGPHKGFGNYQLVGVEAQNDNRGEPWSPLMLDSYQRGVAAICTHQRWPASVVVAHAEHQSGKTDPAGIDMGAFRRRVATLIVEGDDVSVEDVETGISRSWAKAVDRADKEGRNLGRNFTRLLERYLRPIVASELAVVRGEVSGLSALLRELAVAPAVPLSPEQLEAMVVRVEAAAREPGERIAAALAAAGDALGEADDPAEADRRG